MSFVVKVVDRVGRVTWLAPEGPDGARAYRSRKVAEVFQAREDAQIASAKAVQSDGLPGMVFSVESAP
jgi:hypothetical protein